MVSRGKQVGHPAVEHGEVDGRAGGARVETRLLGHEPLRDLQKGLTRMHLGGGGVVKEGGSE